MRHSEYYDQDITEADFDEALEAYHRWCSNNNQNPEVSDDASLEDVSEGELSHILYHAEIEGFKINGED